MSKLILSVLCIVILFLALPAETVKFAKLSQWGSGPYSNCALKGQYAFCAAGYSGLDVIDFSNRRYPAKVANLFLNMNATEIKILGDNVFLLSQKAMVIVNISNPCKPRQLGVHMILRPNNDCRVHQLAVAGNFVYFLIDGTSHSYLDVVAIADKTHPLGQQRYDLTQFIGSDYSHVSYLTIRGQEALLVSSGSQLALLDLSDPLNIRISKNYPAIQDNCSGDFSWKMIGDYAYFYYSRNFYILDARNFFQISVIKKINNQRLASLRDFIVKDGYLYFFKPASDLSEILVYDIHSPVNPVFIQSVKPSWNHNAWDCQSIYANAHTLFLNFGVDGLQLFDITIPERPAWLGASIESITTQEIQIAGSHAYILGAKILQVLDISNPGKPQPVSSASIGEPSYYTHSLSVIDPVAFVSNDYRHMSTHDSSWYGSTIITNFNDPFSPQQNVYQFDVLNFGFEPGYLGERLFSQGDFIYSNGRPNGWNDSNDLIKWDPNYLRRVNTRFALPCLDFKSDGNIGYALSKDKLMVLDTGLLGMPSLGELAVTANELTVDRERVYLLNQQKLQVVSVANPNFPFQVGELSVSWPKDWKRGLVTQGNYVLTGGQELTLINATDPVHPRKTGTYSLPFHYLMPVAWQGNRVYVFAYNQYDGVKVSQSYPINLANQGRYYEGGSLMVFKVTID